MQDDFDGLYLDADLKTALRAANKCAKDAVDLCFRLQMTDFIESVTLAPEDRKPTRLAPRPLPEAPDWMRQDGAKRAATLSASTSALRAALKPLGMSLIGALRGKKQIGGVSALTIHDAILQFSERLLSGLLWFIGNASHRLSLDLTTDDVAKIEEQWALIALQMGNKEIVTTANEAIDEALKLLIEEAVEAQRLRQQPKAVENITPTFNGHADKSSTSAEETFKRAALAMDHTSQQILLIAQSRDLSSDDKLRAICKIDLCYYGRSSKDLGTLLGVSGPAIRQTKWWKEDRKNYVKKSPTLNAQQGNGLSCHR